MPTINYKWLYIFIVLFTLITQDTWQNWINKAHPFEHDIDQYYSYCVGAFVKNTMDVGGELAYRGYWVTKTASGELIRKFTCGMAIMYAPFFLIAHFFSQIIGFSCDGYTGTYGFFISVGTYFYVFMGFFFLRKALLRFYSEKVIALVIFSLFMCTNLFYYTVGLGEMSHSYLFSIYGLYIYSVIRWQETKKQKYLNLIMFCAGLATLIRPTEIICLIFFALYSVYDRATLKARCLLFKKHFLNLLLSLLFFLLPILPQLLYWKLYGGQWIVYSYEKERFFFNDPKILEVLFSYRNGLLVYSPIIIFSLIGLVFLFKKNKSLFWGVFVLFIVSLYVVSCWWSWWFSGGFGYRALIQCFAFLAFPMATFYEAIFNVFGQGRYSVFKKYSIGLVILFFCANNLIRHFQYKWSIIHWDSMSKEAFWFSGWKLNHSAADRKYLESVYIHPDYEKALKGFRDQ